MPIELRHNHTSLLIRRAAFEAHGLSRAVIDARLGLTSDEFQMEGELIVVGPIQPSVDIADVVAELEASGLTYFDDFFDMSGNWPEWFSVFAMARR